MQSLCPAPPREDPERKSCPAHRTPSSAAAGSVLTGRSTDSPSLLDETRPAPAQLPGHRQRESAPRERPGARPWAGRGPASTPKPGAAVLLHLQTGPEHSRAARGREGRPALARLALKDEDERSLSPPGEGPAGWWPLPAPKCSPGPSRADPGPDSSENCEESSTSGKSRRLWHATAAHVNKTGVFRGLAGPDRRPVKLTGLSRSPCSDPCPAGQASGARVPHGGGCRGPLTAPRAPGRRTPCMAVRPQPTGVRGHCRACGWGTLVSLSGTLATEPHIRGSEEN